jgi:hypothetical protein
MPTSPNYRELFSNATIKDKLSLFQNLLDGREEMSPDLAFALLKIIHKDLSTHQFRDRSTYKRYAEMIEVFRFQMPGLLKQVVDSWKEYQNITPSEWFSGRKNLW